MSLAALLAVVVTLDGGGDYVTVVDYEWPTPSISGGPALLVSHNSAAQGGYGTIGAAVVPDWDGGAIIDAVGLRAVRGPVNVWYHFDPIAAEWPTLDGGGKYTVNFTPSFDSNSEWVAGYEPSWNGTTYLFDAWDGSSHTLAIILGSGEKGLMLVRLANSTGYTSINTYVGTPVGQPYSVSVEWVALGAGKCNVWVRMDGCGFAPAVLCRASTIVNSDTSGNAVCPGVPADVILGNRYTASAPTSVHFNSLRVATK